MQSTPFTLRTLLFRHSRNLTLTQTQTRLISRTPPHHLQKPASETIKEAVKKVDRAVADKIVGGIEVGETITQKAKSIASTSSSEAKGKAAEVTGEVKGEVKEKAKEVKGKAKEVKGEMKGKKEEVEGEL
ncbi:hypothetical protein SBOR_6187 [Sclerotinia borealis F-4128]|uniref:Lea domain protein n=1 Tax=Sclerotinia borealis (strain F-4128) TaxID=1432307 RepID=W9CC87_SCLBF|nr:hypothetical protein SBOR_6187 [Sclerotinia borealis F-4128]